MNLKESEQGTRDLLEVQRHRGVEAEFPGLGKDGVHTLQNSPEPHSSPR